MGPALQRAFRNMLRSWRTERPSFSEELGAAESGTTFGMAAEHRGGAMDRIVGKRIGKKLRVPLRALMALDEFTKSMAGQIDGGNDPLGPDSTTFIADSVYSSTSMASVRLSRRLRIFFSRESISVRALSTEGG